MSGAHAAAQTFGALALLLGGGRVGAHLATKLGLPAVVGELGAGIALGTAGRLSGVGAEPGEMLRGMSELGVLLLMFELGLETSLDELRHTGRRAALVATIGAVGALALGTVASMLSGITSGWKGYLFVGAALASTSVGITARVFRDLGQIRSPEAQLVLAAAVIDDILGLLALASLSAMAGQGGSGSIGLVVLKAIAFVVAALLAGRLLVPPLFAQAAKLSGRGGLVVTSMVTCFGFAWAADALGLAPAIGAFFAGAAIRPEHVAPFQARGEGSASEVLGPLTGVFVPVFFVLAGVQLDLAVMASGRAVLGAVLLTLAAALGKLASGLAARGAVPRPMTVGVGMMPLGEVSLIVIATGASVVVDGEPLVGRVAFGAALLTVVFTSLIPPLVLMRLIQRARPPLVTGGADG